MKTQHTPGPWKTIKDAHGVWHIESQDGSAWIAKTSPIRSLTTGMAMFDTEEDARLIASAPELLDALLRCLCALEGRQHPDQKAEDYRDNCIDVATDAIKKATGETP